MRRQTRTWYRLLAMLFSLGLVAAACSSDASDGAAETDTPDETTAETTADTETPDETTDETAAPSDDPAAGPLTIAIVAPSSKDDLAFTQSMIESINALGRDIDLQITDGTFVVEDAAAAIRGYAEDGVEVIIAHGTQYGGSLVEIAPDFPETTFIWGTATDTQGLDNVFAYSPAADEGGYVNGVIAAGLSKSKKIGVVGPIEAGDAVAYIEGFQAAAEAAGAEVSVVYTGSFGDVALASETAEAHLANGADVLTGTAQMVVGAVGVANDAGIPWLGTQANQTSLAPEIVVVSQVYHWEVVLEEMLALRDGGTIGGQAFEINLANGGLVLEFNDGFALSDELKAEADATVAGLIDGSISTGF